MRTFISLLLSTASFSVFAHPGHGNDASFFTGFLHPFGGLDHLLVMLAVAIYLILRTLR